MITFLATIKNKAAYVAETIESVLGQDYKDIEFVIVDDASTDSTPMIIKHYMKTDNRIKLITLNQHHGISKALNKAHKYVAGDIVCVASGDDIYTPYRARVTRKFFTDHPKVDVMYSSFIRCDHKLRPKELKEAPVFSYKRLLKEQYIGHGFMAYKKSCFAKVHYRDDLDVGIDYPFIVDLANAGFKFGRTKKVLGLYRLCKDGVSHTHAKQIHLKDIELRKKEYAV